MAAGARDVLGSPLLKADPYDLEQRIQDEVADDLVSEVLEGTLRASDMLADHFVRDLHSRLYGPVWEWAVGSARVRRT